MEKAVPKNEDPTLDTYRIVEECLHHPDIGSYKTYGIEADGADGVKIVHDVSACRETAASLADLFNEHRLQAIHLEDAVMDMLP